MWKQEEEEQEKPDTWSDWSADILLTVRAGQFEWHNHPPQHEGLMEKPQQDNMLGECGFQADPPWSHSFKSNPAEGKKTLIYAASRTSA